MTWLANFNHYLLINIINNIMTWLANVNHYLLINIIKFSYYYDMVS